MKPSRFRLLPAWLLFGMPAFALSLLVSCTTDPAALDPGLKGTIHVVVLDANTAAPVSGVRVEIVGEASGRTSSTGQISFGELRAGGYLVRLTKDDYEASQEPVTLATAGTEDVAALNVSTTYRIHRQGAVIKGRVLLRPLATSDTTAVVTGGGIKVELRSTATGTGSNGTAYLIPVRTVTTTPNGFFTFDTLPEISSYVVTIPEFQNGGRFYGMTGTAVASGTLLAGQQYTHPNITLSPTTSGTLQVFAHSLRPAANQPLVLEFSAGIDTARFSTTAAQLRSTVGPTTTNIASSRVWNSSLTILSITPATGTWVSGTTYSVVLTGVRDQQNRVLATQTITTNPAP